MKWRVLLFTLIVAISLGLEVLPVSASTNITIKDEVQPGLLSSSVESLTANPNEVTSLTIEKGIVNATDFYYIRDNMTGLKELIIEEEAYVHSTTATTVPNPDHKVPDAALHKNFGTQIEKVVIRSAKVIGTNSFRRNAELKDIELPLVTEVGPHAFASCNMLKEIYLPSVKELKQYSFAWCNSLEEGRFPELLKTGDSTFTNCKKLKLMEAPNLASINEDTFYDCHSLEEANFPLLTFVGSYGFAYCESLINVNLPLVTMVEDTAFYGCESLVTLELPSATYIGVEAISECDVLETLNLPNVTEVAYCAFYDCDVLTTVNIPKLRIMGASVFEGCGKLKSIDIPLVESMGDRAFWACYELESLNLPKVTHLEEKAFSECYKLGDLNIPNVRTIENLVFEECESLESLELPKLESIGDESFLNAHNLKSLRVGMSPPLLGDDVFLNASSSASGPQVSVPFGSVDAYKSDPRDGDTSDNKWFGFEIKELAEQVYLSDLTFSHGQLDDYFAGDQTFYTLYNIDSQVMGIQITPYVDNQLHTIEVSNQEVISGQSITVPLVDIMQSVTITVTSQAGNKTVYTVVIQKLEQPILKEEEEDEQINIDSVLARLNTVKKGGTAEIDIYDRLRISNTALKVVAMKDIKLVLKDSWYRWVINGEMLTEEDVFLPFNPLLDLMDSKTMGMDLLNKSGIMIDTQHRGEIPTGTRLEFNFHELNKGYMYSLKGFNKSLKFEAKGDYQEPWLSFPIETVGSYIVSSTPVLKGNYLEIPFITGYEDGSFKPEQGIKREELACILSQLLVYQGVKISSDFHDTSSWSRVYVNLLNSLDLISGYEDGSFKPSQEMTRAELAFVLAKLKGLKPLPEEEIFKDCKGHWAEGLINAMVIDGNIVGYGHGMFKPDAPATRAEAVTMLIMLMEKDITTKQLESPYTDMMDDYWALPMILNATY